MVVAVVSLVLAGAAAAVLIVGNSPTGLLPFGSYAEMASYISGTQSASRNYAGGSMFSSPGSMVQAPAAGTAAT